MKVSENLIWLILRYLGQVPKVAPRPSRWSWRNPLLKMRGGILSKPIGFKGKILHIAHSIWEEDWDIADQNQCIRPMLLQGCHKSTWYKLQFTISDPYCIPSQMQVKLKIKISGRVIYWQLLGTKIAVGFQDGNFWPISNPPKKWVGSRFQIPRWVLLQKLL